MNKILNLIDRFIEESTLKQAIIPDIISIVAFFLVIHLDFTTNALCLFYLLLPVLLFLIFAFTSLIFYKISNIKINKNKEKIAKLVNSKLSTTTFALVSYQPVDASVMAKFYTDTITKLNLSLYAKLDEDKNIIIVAKDLNGKVISELKVSNYEYFLNNFSVYNFK